MILTLPLPPSPNDRAGHGMQEHRRKRAYQREAWAAAYAQAIPPYDPPARVRVSARFYVHNLRDEDGLTGSLKYALDALRQRQASRTWRRGLGEDRGYLIDDSPRHMELGDVTQAIDRSAPRLVLEIEDIGQEAVA